MKKMLIVIFLGFFCTGLFAQDHLLVTEICVSPTDGEFIEIYNPTNETIDLTNYYISDATYSPDGTFYYNTVTGNGGGGSFADFNAKFPDGATIAAGAYQILALTGSAAFSAVYGMDPTYELFEDDAAPDAIPDMLEATAGSIAGQGGLSDAGEVVVMYMWDGQSDLVQDVDYVLWGDKAEAVDKTGVSVDGPDADSDATPYLADTATDDQAVVNADNDDDEDPHDDGMSAQRILSVEDLENWLDGNGITGHDETSEDVSWKGGIWCLNTAPTPGARALGDSLNIADLQYIRAEDIGSDANDDSPFTGDTLTVSGIMMVGPREIYLGARWGAFIQDETGGPWSGFFVIQNDTSVSGTMITSAQTGDKIRMTGVLDEYPTGANTPSITQFALITDPVTPIEFVDFGLPIPDPIVLTPGDIGASGVTADPQLSERWEGVLARFEMLTVTANGLPGNIMTAGDETGSIGIDDYFNATSTIVSNNGGVWPGFPAGTKINVTGFIRGGTSSGTVTINPRTLDDIEVASAPPEITDIARDPVSVTPTDDVEISATIVDAQTSVAKAEIYYSVDGGRYAIVEMSAADNIWSGVIPAQADDALVEYFLKAEDTDGDATTAPGDTTASMFFYYVREGGIGIFDIQYTPFDDGNSGYTGLEVTVTGIATSDSADFGYYYIQDGTDPWSGIWIYDFLNPVNLGDEVSVTGTVQEQYNVTRISDVTNVTVLSTGNTVPEPLALNVSDLMTGSPSAESYEGMLVRVENLTVVDPFPDSPGNYGEFSISDGTGSIRVDDEGNIRGNLDSTYVQGDSLISLTGIQYFSFYDYKIIPRNENDIVRYGTLVATDKRVPFVYKLAENYPNPFNPETTIRYQLAQKNQVTIKIFNLLGQKVKTLVDEVGIAGNHNIHWDGTNDLGSAVSSGVYFYQMKSGDFISTKKMLFMK